MKKSKKKKARPRSTLNRISLLFCIGTAVLTLLGFSGRFHWSLELLSHFRIQIFQLTLIASGIMLWRKNYRILAGMLLLTIINYATILPLYWGNTPPREHPPVRAMLMNIHASNGNTEEVMESIKINDPDLLLLLEVTPLWANEFTALYRIYPYRIEKAQEGCFGILLLSKYPLKKIGKWALESKAYPALSTEVQLPQGPVALIGAHLVPPINSTAALVRNRQLQQLSHKATTQRFPALILGDLNCTPWSPNFRDLLKTSGLKNSMKGFGVQPSWPANNRLIQIPIDHLLYASEIHIYQRLIGLPIGSDHLPLIVDFSVNTAD